MTDLQPVSFILVLDNEFRLTVLG